MQEYKISVFLRKQYGLIMETDIWQEIEQLYRKFQKLGISEAVDYEKYYLYSLITHSTAIEAKRIVRLQDGKIIYDGDARDPRAVVQPDLEQGDMAGEVLHA